MKPPMAYRVSNSCSRSSGVTLNTLWLLVSKALPPPEYRQSSRISG